MYRIEFLEDSNECETCGWNSAEGYRIYLNDKVIIDKTPSASCFGGGDYYSHSPYKDILELIGIPVTEDNGEVVDGVHPCLYDEEDD